MARPDVDLAKLEIRRISSSDGTAEFSCGEEDLNDFLRSDALRLDELGIVRVCVALFEGELVGYAAILTDSVRLKTTDIKKLDMEFQDHPGVPALKVGRLAVSERFKERYRGLGSAMMGYCYSIGAIIAANAGCRLLTVDALPQSIRFYEKLGFVRNNLKPDKGEVKLPPGPGDCVSMRFDLKTDPLPPWCLGD